MVDMTQIRYKYGTPNEMSVHPSSWVNKKKKKSQILHKAPPFMGSESSDWQYSLYPIFFCKIVFLGNIFLQEQHSLKPTSFYMYKMGTCLRKKKKKKGDKCPHTQ